MGLTAEPNRTVSSKEIGGASTSKQNNKPVIELYDIPESDAPSRKSRFPLNKEEEIYIAKCMEKFGDDYASMFRDIRGVNKLQYTENKLRKLGARFLLLTSDQRRIEVPALVAERFSL